MLKSYYPVNLDVSGKKCLVVGGGAVAERKVKTLLDFGALVWVVAPRFSFKIKGVKFIRRKYRSGDLRNAVLAIAATDDDGLNRKIAAGARAQKIPVNVIDAPKLCTFIAPSIIKRGPLVVSISTSGQAPALAKALRLKLEKLITPQFGKLALALGKIRRAKQCAS